MLGSAARARRRDHRTPVRLGARAQSHQRDITVTSRFAQIVDALRHQLALSPALTGLGFLGVTLGALCMVGAVIHGDRVHPEGSLIETATFNGSIGVFVLTIGVLLPGVRWTRRGRRVWIVLMVAAMVYAYGIETVQAFRGLDPRFSRVAGPVDQALGGVFLIDALFIMGLFTVLTVKYFRTPSTPVVVAVRYGTVACFIAFSVGILMSATNGRQVGEAGNLLVLHAAGFHGLQAVPFVALLLQWAGGEPSRRGRLVHLAGLSWLGACAAIGWQSGAGVSVTEISAAAVVTGLCLLTFGVVAVRAVLGWVFNAKYAAPQSDATV